MVPALHLFAKPSRQTAAQASAAGKELAMKWLLFVFGLTVLATLSGCCQGGGLFSQGGYGTSYYPANYYAAPAASYTSNPCACQ